MEAKEIIKGLRLSRGMTQQQLADELDIRSYTTISKWESGENTPQGKDLIKLSKLFNVSVDRLLGIEVKKKGYFHYKYFPTYVSAGLPNDVEAVTEYETISISDEIMGKYANNKDIYFIKINGESMNKIIPHDSLIAVRPVSSIHDLKTGDIVVYRKDGEYAVKRLVIDDDKWIFKPESTDDRFYDDVIYKDADVKIKGKVVLYIVEV